MSGGSAIGGRGCGAVLVGSLAPPRASPGVAGRWSRAPVAPLLLPLLKELGIDPILFAAITGVNLAMGGVTPPYASILYLGMRIGKCESTEILGPTMIFLIFGYIPIVFLTTYWPDLSLFLPRLMGYVP